MWYFVVYLLLYYYSYENENDNVFINVRLSVFTKSNTKGTKYILIDFNLCIYEHTITNCVALTASGTTCLYLFILYSINSRIT